MGVLFPIALCTLHYAQCTIHIALWTHCTVRISLCTFHCAQFTVQIALCAQLCKVAKMQRCLKTEVGYTQTHRQTSKGTGWLLELLSQLKMPQRRDNAGAVCDSGIACCSQIVNFCRAEDYCTKKGGRILPGFYWYHQKKTSYVVQGLTTSPTFDKSEA